MMSTSRTYLLALVSLIPSCILPQAVAAASSASASGTSSLSYVSVRALDKYGHSEQLQNALKAANLQGTLVVAARDSESNSTIILSLLESPESPTSPRIDDNPSMLHPMNNNVPFLLSSIGNLVQPAIVCTGVKGDARWLIDKVQDYSHRVWTRYNTFVDAPGIAYAVSKYMRKFWSYDEEGEWAPGLLLQDLVKKKKNEDQSESWSRPLGLVAMIVAPSLPYIFVVEPSGVIQRYTAFAMGKHSTDVLEKLGSELVVEGKADDPAQDLQSRLIKVIRRAVPSSKKDTSILVEVLSESGLNRTVIVG